MSFARRLGTDAKFRKTMLLLAGGTALALGVGVAGTIGALQSKPSAGSSTAPRPTLTHDVGIPLAPPTTAAVPATFAEWTSAAAAPALSAEGGDASDGSIALLLDPAAGGAGVSQSFAVLPATEYAFSIMARAATDAPASLSASMGGEEPAIQLIEASSDEWQEFSWSYVTRADQSILDLSLSVNGGSSAIRVDALSATTPDGTEVVLNGSFEEYDAPRQLTNTSLVMQAEQAMIGVSWRAPQLLWKIDDRHGRQIETGELTPAGGISLIPLGDLTQGFYTATISDPAGLAEPIASTFMVLDEDLTKRDEVDDRFGVMIHVDRDYYSQSGRMAAALGFGTVRTDVRWAHVETTQGQYDFPDNLNVGIDEIKGNRLDVLPVSAFRNPFYDNNRVPSSEEALAAYASYTDALISHYGFNAVEIFNEFNNPPVNNSACGPTPECYMQLLVANADRVHQNHPETLVVGPANAHKDDAFLTSLYQQGALNYLDVVSFHPYDYDYDENKGAEFLVESLGQAQDRIKEYNNGVAKPIWLTELGWSSTLVKTDELQADYLVRAQAISLGNGVERFYWYDLVNDHLSFLDHEGNFGMVRRASETVPSFQPKLSAMAQAVLVSRIGGKDYSGQDELDATSYSYVFGSGKDATRVAWATTPATVSFAAKGPVTVTDQYGAVSQVQPVKGKITVELGGQSIYLDGELGRAAVLD